MKGTVTVFAVFCNTLRIARKMGSRFFLGCFGFCFETKIWLFRNFE